MIDELLCTGAYDYLLLRAYHASCLVKIPCYLLSECRLTLTVSFRQQQLRCFIKHCGHAFLPLDKIKGLRVEAERHIIILLHPGIAVVSVFVPVLFPQASMNIFYCSTLCGIVSGLRPADEIPFCHQLLIGLFNCRDAHANGRCH